MNDVCMCVEQMWHHSILKNSENAVQSTDGENLCHPREGLDVTGAGNRLDLTLFWDTLMVSNCCQTSEDFILLW